jgi:dolichol-phosphate mannosyltransferase
LISVAAPAKDEIEALPELHRRVEAVMDGIGADWELVIADDGSTDGSRDYLRGLAERDPRVRGILLSRNFGHTPAYMAALEHTRGDWVVLMDADLQDEPESIPRLLEMAGQGNDVVYAVRGRRPEPLLMRAGFALYYRLAARISTVDQPPHAGPFCLMSRRVVDRISTLPERSLFFPGVRSYVGYQQAGVRIDRAPRSDGSSRIPLRRRIAGALDGLFAFSSAPLRLAASLGVAVATLSGLLLLFFLYFKLFTSVPVRGFTALITIFLFVGGVQLLTVGIIGEYLGRVYDEVKRRPRYVVEERVNVEAGSGPGSGERPDDLGPAP